MLTPGRDRVIGILLALVVMWAVYHRIHPERAVEKMRHRPAELLRVVADIVPLLGRGSSDRITALRDKAGAIVSGVRALADERCIEIQANIH